jgi:parallel beta-helix repeat protein
MIQTNQVRKGLVIGIVILLIGVSVPGSIKSIALQQSTTISKEENSNDINNSPQTFLNPVKSIDKQSQHNEMPWIYSCKQKALQRSLPSISSKGSNNDILVSSDNPYGDDINPKITVNPQGTFVITYEQLNAINASKKNIPVCYSTTSGETWILNSIFNSSNVLEGTGTLQSPDIKYCPDDNTFFWGAVDPYASMYNYELAWIPGNIEDSPEILLFPISLSAASDYTASGLTFVGKWLVGLHIETIYNIIQTPCLFYLTYNQTLGNFPLFPHDINQNWAGGFYYDGQSLLSTAPASHPELATGSTRMYMVMQHYNSAQSYPEIVFKSTVTDLNPQSSTFLFKSGGGPGGMDKYADIECWPWRMYLETNASDPDISAKGTTVCVVYTKNSDVMCKYSSNSGDTWGTSTVATNASFPSVFVAQNNVFCAFTKSGNLYLAISHNGGETWSDYHQINDVNGSVSNINGSIDVSDGGVVWTDHRNGMNDIYFQNIVNYIIPSCNSTIHGYVYDSSGNVLPGAIITIYNSSWFWRNSTITDENGYYEINSFGGWFNFSVKKPLYYPYYQTSYINDNASYFWNITLQPYDTVCGYVREPDTTPIEGATVHLHGIEDYLTQTDVSGYFIFNHTVPAGYYRSEVYKNGSQGFPPTPGASFNVSRNETYWLNFTIFPPMIIWVDDNYNESTPNWGYDHFNKIQDGVNAVAESGIVYVSNGTYYENIIINKTINLIGKGSNNTIIDGEGSGDVVTIYSNRANLSGFTIQFSGSNPTDAGIKVSSNTTNIFGNNITNTNCGIWLTPASDGNTIFHNNFINNSQHANDSGTDNVWDRGYLACGNYWDDYSGSDNYYGPDQNIPGSDGVGDTPYNISGGNTKDRYPLINPWNGSSPVQLLPTVYVDDDYNDTIPNWGYQYFNRIQDGINAVAEDGTVFVYNGTYYENVFIDKTIRLIGEDKNTTIIDANGIGDVINVSTDRVNISNFTLQNADTNAGTGIYLFFNTNYTTISRNIIIHTYTGIRSSYLFEPSHCRIINNIISNTYSLNCIFIPYSDSNNISNNIISNNSNSIGINGYYSDNDTISNNIFSKNYGGILLGQSMNTIISGNNLSNISINQGSIYLENGFMNIISHNTIVYCNGGIQLMQDSSYNTISSNVILHTYWDVGIAAYSNYNNISGNIFSAVEHGTGFAIVITQSSSNTILDNTANDFYMSVYLDCDSNNNVISTNNILHNDFGILFSDSNNNIISMNNILNNFIGLYLLGSNNNVISENEILGSEYYSICLSSDTRCDNNHIYHNNICGTYGSINAEDYWTNYWDNGYPDGGNYWNDYNGIDRYHGSNQNILGPDGIGDTPYGISGGSNQDRYPFMQQEGWVNHPPCVPTDPSPANESEKYNIHMNLSWSGGDPDLEDTVTYDIYFGNTNPPPKIVSNQSATIYVLDALNENTTYYWKIVSWDNHGASAVGPIWHFTIMKVVCGDANNDDIINVVDVVYLINYLFIGGPAPVPMKCVGDVNGDGIVNISDVVYLINYLFIHGPAPVAGCCG